MVFDLNIKTWKGTFTPVFKPKDLYIYLTETKKGIALGHHDNYALTFHQQEELQKKEKQAMLIFLVLLLEQHFSFVVRMWYSLA